MPAQLTKPTTPTRHTSQITHTSTHSHLSWGGESTSGLGAASHHDMYPCSASPTARDQPAVYCRRAIALTRPSTSAHSATSQFTPSSPSRHTPLSLCHLLPTPTPDHTSPQLSTQGIHPRMVNKVERFTLGAFGRQTKAKAMSCCTAHKRTPFGTHSLLLHCAVTYKNTVETKW